MYNIAVITFLHQTPVQIKFNIYSIIQAQLIRTYATLLMSKIAQATNSTTTITTIDKVSVSGVALKK